MRPICKGLVGSVNKSIDIYGESILIYICLMSVDVDNVLLQWLQGFCYNNFRLAIIVLKDPTSSNREFIESRFL